MKVAIFVNEKGLPIAIPGLHACAHSLRTKGFEVVVFDFFEGEPADLLPLSAEPWLVVLWRSNSFDGELPILDAWLPLVNERAQVIKERLPGSRVVIAGWLEYFKEALQQALPATALDAAFLSGYEFGDPLVSWLSHPGALAEIHLWPEKTTERKRTVDLKSPQYPWPGRFIMASPPVCDRVCGKCAVTDRCLRRGLDTSPAGLRAMLDEFQAEIDDCAAQTQYIYAVSMDIGHEPAVLAAIQASAKRHPHLKWFIALSLHEGIPAGALERLRDIPLGGLELFCPSFNADSQVALGLPRRNLVGACEQIARQLPAETYLEVSSYVGLPGDSPESIEHAWVALERLERVDNLNFIPLFLAEDSPIFKAGHYTWLPEGPASLFGRPAWRTAHLDSEWIRTWLAQKRPALPKSAPLVANVFWLQYLFHLVMNGYRPDELRALRRAVGYGQLTEAQADIEAHGRETQARVVAWAQQAT